MRWLSDRKAFVAIRKGGDNKPTYKTFRCKDEDDELVMDEVREAAKRWVDGLKSDQELDKPDVVSDAEEGEDNAADTQRDSGESA